MVPQVELFSFVFWENWRLPKRHFEINWPLICTLYQTNTFQKLLFWSTVIHAAQDYGIDLFLSPDSFPAPKIQIWKIWRPKWQKIWKLLWTGNELGAVQTLCCLRGEYLGGGGGRKLPILLSKKTTKRGEWGSKIADFETTYFMDGLLPIYLDISFDAFVFCIIGLDWLWTKMRK
jgi:hypothetical protein